MVWLTGGIFIGALGGRVILFLGITLASNLAAGFLTGIIAAHLLRWKRLPV